MSKLRSFSSVERSHTSPMPSEERERERERERDRERESMARATVRCFRDEMQLKLRNTFVLLKKIFNIDTEICGAFAEARVFELLKDSVYTLRDDEVPLDELFKFLNKL